MCNSMHENSTVLDKESSVGFKIFGINNTSMVCSTEYRLDKTGWARWKTVPNNQGIGFCVFVNEEEARGCCALWVNVGIWNHDSEVRKVKYSGAVAEHIEDSIITSGHDKWLVRLVKRFKILEDI